MKASDNYKDFIPVNEPLLNGNELKYVTECIKSGWISSEGPFVKRFEDQFARQVQRKHGVAVCNGSVALDLAVKVLGIQPGDEVIIPSFTIISCALSIIRAGAIPVFIDSDMYTWNMNVQEIETKITGKTKAIMIVHIYGLPVDIDPVLECAKKYNLFIIEDAAEMHGQTYKGIPCGSFGDISCFSFYPNKHITTGEGGMVVTNEDKLADKLRYYRNLCFIPERRFIHYDIGWNFRFTNIQAAIGLAQLEHLGESVHKKRALGNLYNQYLSELTNKNLIQIPVAKTEYAENIYWVYGLLLTDNVKFSVEHLSRKLAENGIGTRPFFYPMHLQPVFKNESWFKTEKLPNAEAMSERGFYLPSGLGMDLKNIQKICEILSKIILDEATKNH